MINNATFYYIIADAVATTAIITIATIPITILLL